MHHLKPPHTHCGSPAPPLSHHLLCTADATSTKPRLPPPSPHPSATHSDTYFHTHQIRLPISPLTTSLLIKTLPHAPLPQPASSLALTHSPIPHLYLGLQPFRFLWLLSLSRNPGLTATLSRIVSLHSCVCVWFSYLGYHLCMDKQN